MRVSRIHYKGKICFFYAKYMICNLTAHLLFKAQHVVLKLLAPNLYTTPVQIMEPASGCMYARCMQVGMFVFWVQLRGKGRSTSS